jgi:hypothetical protein
MWGKAVTGARGVSPKRTIAVKYILSKNCWGTTEIVGIYAGFSPVLPDRVPRIIQQLVVAGSEDNYRLCFA